MMNLYYWFFIFLIIVICVQLFYQFLYSYIKRLRSRSPAWVYIGELKEILIYPVEGGPAKKLQEAICSENGLKSVDDFEDRCFVATLNEVAIPDLCTFGMATRDFSTMLKDFLSNARKNSRHIKRRKINYLGHDVIMHELQYEAVGDSIVKCIKENLGDLLKICYFPPAIRRQFMENVRSTLKRTETTGYYDGFSQNFSPYTLINTKSVEAIRKRTGVPRICTATFRPHLVIDVDQPYCEDNYTSMKIGKAQFKDILPCTHTLFINSVNLEGPDHFEPYGALKRTRPLNILRPDLSDSNSPVFGINMELKPGKDAKIAVGDRIYVKLRK